MFGNYLDFSKLDLIIIFHIIGLVGFFYYKLLFYLLSFINISIG
jgi:hypothetical protein